MKKSLHNIVSFQETTSRMMELTEVPKGYNDVHGLKTSDELPSEFKGDEYAIFSTSQQRIRYGLPGLLSQVFESLLHWLSITSLVGS